ncbi:E3 ubiquitin-protein ligase DCST1 [Gastrophryne carolinensis]
MRLKLQDKVKKDYVIIQDQSDEETTSGKRRAENKKTKPPNTTLKKIVRLAFPQFCSAFLFSEPKEFKYTKFFLGMGVGGFIGLAIYLTMIDPLNLSALPKACAGYVLAILFAIGWGTSRYFRCTCLIIIPNILGKEGRVYLLVFVMAAIYEGPGANVQHNFQEIPRSIGCTAELQVNNTKMLWTIMTTPINKILENIASSGSQIKNISKDVKVAFKDVDNDVASTEGYNKIKAKNILEEERPKTLSTQRLFELKSLLRCEYVVELGIGKCHEWFEKKHAECMRVITVPLLSHILCLPMQMTFFCNVLHLGGAWCKKHLPLDDMFGAIFDKTNFSVTGMAKDFAVKVVEKQEEQSMVSWLKTKASSIMENIKYKIEKKKAILAKSVSFVKVIMSCTFIFLFLSAYKYTVQYNKDIRHDNCYVTTYFRQIDARRRKQNKRYLLPLKNGEKPKFIFPWQLKVQGPEIKSTLSEIWQCILPITFLVLAIIFDRALVRVLEIIREHSKISYVFDSHHNLQVSVGGNSFIAKLLRTTIGILNSTSNTFLTSDTERCLPIPIHMMSYDYIWACLPVVAYICLSIGQVYFYRLRRVVAAFYFPKREKRRVIFLYNEQLRKREEYKEVKKKQIRARALIGRRLRKSTMGVLYRYCSCLRKIIQRHCIVCDQSERKTSYVCPTPNCETVYCRQCWRDMEKFCFACTPYEEFVEGHAIDSNYDSD